MSSSQENLLPGSACKSSDLFTKGKTLFSQKEVVLKFAETLCASLPAFPQRNHEDKKADIAFVCPRLEVLESLAIFSDE